MGNPTGTDRDFAVHGLYIVPEHVTGPFKSDYFTGPKTINALRPINVLVKAKSTLKIAVARMLNIVIQFGDTGRRTAFPFGHILFYKDFGDPRFTVTGELSRTSA